MRKIKLNQNGLDLFTLTEFNTFEYLGVVNSRHEIESFKNQFPDHDYGEDDSVYFIKVRKVETKEIQYLFLREVV